MPESPVRELRLALTVERYDEAVAFYRDALGLPVIESFERPGGGGVVLDAGRATLELLSVGQAELVDEVEVGARVAGPVRVALEPGDRAALSPWHSPSRGTRVPTSTAREPGGPGTPPDVCVALHRNSLALVRPRGVIRIA